jgi:hypothetical protein
MLARELMVPLVGSFEDPREVLQAVPQLDEARGDLVEIGQIGRGHQVDCDGPELVKLTVWTKPN